jgi:hypothetical protein
MNALVNGPLDEDAGSVLKRAAELGFTRDAK